MKIGFLLRDRGCSVTLASQSILLLFVNTPRPSLTVLNRYLPFITVMNKNSQKRPKTLYNGVNCGSVPYHHGGCDRPRIIIFTVSYYLNFYLLYGLVEKLPTVQSKYRDSFVFET